MAIFSQLKIGTGEIRTCPGDSIFNPDSEEECDVPCEPCPDFNPCSRDSEGVFENRKDTTCKSYIACSRGTPFTLSCPSDANPESDQIFDPERKYCVWDYQYQCPSYQPVLLVRATPAPLFTKKKVVCYYPTWAYYRKGNDNHFQY